MEEIKEVFRAAARRAALKCKGLVSPWEFNKLLEQELSLELWEYWLKQHGYSV
ncbi:hypothetical protein [Deinococcus sp. YIM 77859]|uniref:hypothetical protein n=1 Tax=Deinococcus sp. YIM 77859 TaxID=1540221 RepID=UPI0012E0A95D|nr:hypothetical protein [Deinococcus sp. YIM 77859]